MERSGSVRDPIDSQADRDAIGQLAGMAVMLTVTRDYLPDVVLRDLVQRLGGATAYVDGVLSIGFSMAESRLQEGLLEGAREVLTRLRRLSGDPSPS